MAKKQSTRFSSEKHRVSRRDFLRFCTLAGISSTLFPHYLFADSCDLTSDDIQGPFYSAGAPLRSVLAGTSEPGDRLFISGKVYGDDCVTPLEGTIVDVWAANDSGCYSRFEACTPVGDTYNLRGQMLTDAEGNYAFETVRPGWYLNGAQFRPQHVHFRFVTPTNIILVTQLYFEGDPYIASDPWASAPNAVNRIIPLEQRSDGFHGVLNVNLDMPVVTGIDDPNDLLPDESFLHQNFPNPFNGQTNIRYTLPATARIQLNVYDIAGREVSRIDDGIKSAGFYTASWNGIDDYGQRMASGIYLYRLHAKYEQGSFIQTQKMLMVN